MKLISTIFLALSLLSTAANAQHEEGKAVFDKWCVICHDDSNPSSGGGTETLAILYRGTEIPAKLEDRTDLSPELIRATVRLGRQTMPNFRITEISDSELEAIVEYLTRNN